VPVTTRRDGLRQRREELGITQEELARQLGVSTTTYRNWERGIYLPRIGLRPRLADRLSVTLEEVGRWFGDARLTPKGMSVPAWLGHLATLQQGAGQILHYQNFVVPALLQTESYATAVERAEPVSEADALLRVKARMARQAILTRQPEPLELRVLLDESVLYRIAGDAPVMAGQLDRLARAAELPSIDLRIIPFDAGLFSAAWGSFQIFTSPDSTEPFMACTEDRLGAHYLDRAAEVDAHVKLFADLERVALSVGDTTERVRTVAKERYQ
jgi:transcriptional regulator with XRE-family HTH domain